MKKLLASITIFLLLSFPLLHVFAEPVGTPGESPGTEDAAVPAEEDHPAADDITITAEKDPSAEELTAEGAVVIEQRTGKILYGKQEHNRLYPASTTKILTALIASEYGHPDEVVTVGDEVNLIAWDGTKAGLVQDEKITMRDLILGMLINSGNDAANTIAVHIARSVSGKDLATQDALNAFSEMMNRRAKEAGARDSHFANPHGYHDPEHYTTAYDLAMIGRAAMENEFFRQAISVISMDTKYWATGEPRFWRSKNKLLNKNDSEYYEYATGGKTGYTSKSGQCLVSFATRDDLDLITVVLNAASGQQWGETKKLFEYGFNGYEYVPVLEKGAIVETFPVENYASDDWGSLAVEISAEDWGDVFPKEDIPEIRKEMQWDQSLVAGKKENAGTLPRLNAPIAKGQIIGEMTVTLRGKVLAKAPLTAVRDVKKKTMLDILTPGGKEHSLLWVIPIAAVALVFVLLKPIVFLITRKRRRRYYEYRGYRRY